MSTEEYDERQARSVAELAAGRLPLSAQERIAGLRAAGGRDFTSDLSVDEHHAVRSVGFHPVGQVLGCCVYSVGYTGSWNCGYAGWGGGRGWIGGVPGVGGVAGPLGGGWGGFTAPHEVTPLRQALVEGRRRALRRLRDEASALGADGVVAVRFTASSFPTGYNASEYNVIGTAVRADGRKHLDRPFLSDLSGQDFAKLLLAGWVPVDVVLGLSVQIRHDDWATRVQRGSWQNTEIDGYSALIRAARAASRKQVGQETSATGADGVVLADMELALREKPCSGPGEGEDHLVQALVIGTAISRMARRASTEPRVGLPMIRLTERGARR